MFHQEQWRKSRRGAVIHAVRPRLAGSASSSGAVRPSAGAVAAGAAVGDAPVTPLCAHMASRTLHAHRAGARSSSSDAFADPLCTVIIIIIISKKSVNQVL